MLCLAFSCIRDCDVSSQLFGMIFVGHNRAFLKLHTRKN